MLEMPVNALHLQFFFENLPPILAPAQEADLGNYICI